MNVHVGAEHNLDYDFMNHDLYWFVQDLDLTKEMGLKP